MNRRKPKGSCWGCGRAFELHQRHWVTCNECDRIKESERQARADELASKRVVTGRKRLDRALRLIDAVNRQIQRHKEREKRFMENSRRVHLTLKQKRKMLRLRYWDVIRGDRD